MRQLYSPSRSVTPALCLIVLTAALLPAAVKYDNALRKVTAIPTDKQLVVSLDAVGNYRFEKFELNNPKRVVIDLIHLNNEIRTGRIPVLEGNETVKDILISQFRSKNPAITRVTLTLGSGANGYNVVREGGQMRVIFTRETRRAIDAVQSPKEESVVSMPSANPSVSPSKEPENHPVEPEEQAAATPLTLAESDVPAFFRMASMHPNPRRLSLQPLARRIEPLSVETVSATAAAEETNSTVNLPQPEPVVKEGLTESSAVTEPPIRIEYRPNRTTSVRTKAESTTLINALSNTSSVHPENAAKENDAPSVSSEPTVLLPEVESSQNALGLPSLPSNLPLPTKRASQPIEIPWADANTAGEVSSDGHGIPALLSMDSSSFRTNSLNVTASIIVPKNALEIEPGPPPPPPPAETANLIASDLQARLASRPTMPTGLRNSLSLPTTPSAPLPLMTGAAIPEAPSDKDKVLEKPVDTAASKPPLTKSLLPSAESKPLSPEKPKTPENASKDRDLASEPPKQKLDLIETPIKIIAPSMPTEEAGSTAAANSQVKTIPVTPAPTKVADLGAASRVPIIKSPEAAISHVLSASNTAKETAPNSTAAKVASRLPSIAPSRPGTPDRSMSAPVQDAKPAVATSAVNNARTNIPSISTQYMGEPIDFNVKDFDLVDFFRVMSEISGLNISVDPDVSGKVTMSLTAVPWDQIFDLALSTHKLVRKTEGNVVRVSRKETLQSEEKAVQTLKEAQIAAMELQTSTLKLNYSNSEMLMPTLEKQLTSKGSIVSDKRTNTLIITDIPPKLESLFRLVQSLDIPEKQVRIEARVVQATRNFAQEIGINLGFLAGYGQRVTAGAPPVRQSNPGSMYQNVNLGAIKNFGQTAIKVGTLVDTFQLDAAIQAGESKGIAKLISRPTTSGQNNSEAIIRQGVRFPIQTIQNNTISIQYQDAALTLRVTPQITHENTILLKLRVENNVADFTRVVNGIPSIQTNESETIVLVPDGGTTVIGGILIDDDRNTVDAVPGLGSIPVFGNLFKKRSLDKRSQEVLFFITPTLIE